MKMSLFDLGVKVTQKVATLPLHHVICELQKLKFRRRYIWKKRDERTD